MRYTHPSWMTERIREYIVALTFRRVGNAYYLRTPRGRKAVTRNWMRKYPRMFTKEARRNAKV